ncbi:DNA-directed RNA polymerase III subunit RPC9 isoform X2 [Colletes gigas]|uniref:DNA-directed RNA polymerase III subunit RPC9 isoform X2 n=1 Tax=Colletes gigas TaxID=935657 RepID=UPI001C9A3B5C|nr:DNA-directed RNA polymerase III subunit RPC9 isoform X2 [Colletes gigas]
MIGLKDCSAYLSNYEVLDILQNIKANKKQKMKQNQLATITYQTIRYLEETPCKRQSPEKIKDFLKAIEPYKLTKCEKLTLLNVCPKTALEIQLIVEDSEDRLNDEEVESLLQVITSILGEDEQADKDGHHIQQLLPIKERSSKVQLRKELQPFDTPAATNNKRR